MLDISHELLEVFHKVAIPFSASLALTMAKLAIDRRPFRWEEANNVALDLVVIAVGIAGYFYAANEQVISRETLQAAKDATADGLVVDGLLGAGLLYLRAARRTRGRGNLSLPPISASMGRFQLLLGLVAIVWTALAF